MNSQVSILVVALESDMVCLLQHLILRNLYVTTRDTVARSFKNSVAGAVIDASPLACLKLFPPWSRDRTQLHPLPLAGARAISSTLFPAHELVTIT
jgi:hypothetical protein